ncbi:MAG: septum formation family protein [Actinomycetota bacterium]|nr:septum formation family protein [Actinomycetota bacterium]
MRRTARGSAVVLVALLAAGCSKAGAQPQTEADRLTPPRLGACRVLHPTDVTAPSNASAPVPCTNAHTAQTFAIGTLPAATGSSYDDPRHGGWIFHHCGAAFMRFVGADQSVAMRIQLSWAWFRPSSAGWEKGARWYRCDVVGGPANATAYRNLPTKTRGLFQGPPSDTWLTCARGPSIPKSVQVACTQPHDWRAVTTIKLGQPKDPYPGDRLVQVRSRNYCSDSVGAWSHYPPDYTFGYTWFRKAQWQAGNRRSICWARTSR